MNARTTSIARTAWCAMHGAGMAGGEAFATVVGLADGGFGLVVVDQGNPRRRTVKTLARTRAH